MKLWPADLLDVSGHVQKHSRQISLGFVDVQFSILRMLPDERAIRVDATRVARDGGNHSNTKRTAEMMNV